MGGSRRLHDTVPAGSFALGPFSGASEMQFWMRMLVPTSSLACAHVGSPGVLASPRSSLSAHLTCSS